MLRCNNIKCRKQIQKVCLTTNCSHVFCRSCMINIRKSKICIACKSLCTDSDMTIKELDVIPSLVGYTPCDVMEACRNAMAFYHYQLEQESAIYNAVIDGAEAAYEKIKHEMKSQKANYELEIESLKNNIERVERSLERERQSNYDLGLQLEEKSKQYQKLVQAALKQKYNTGVMQDATNILNIKKD